MFTFSFLEKEKEKSKEKNFSLRSGEHCKTWSFPLPSHRPRPAAQGLCDQLQTLRPTLLPGEAPCLSPALGCDVHSLCLGDSPLILLVDGIFQKGPPWPLFPESSLPCLVHLGTKPLSPRPSLQGPAPSVGVRPPWGQGPHPLSSPRIGWDEGTWEGCSEIRVVLAGLWDADIFVSSLYFIQKPVPVFITYYLYNQEKKTNNKKDTQKMHF